MNKQMKLHLESVIDGIVAQDMAAATDAFHNYLRLKSQSILIGESDEDDDESDDKEDKKSKEKKDDKEVDKDVKKIEKDVKKTKKDQKKDVDDSSDE